MVALSSLKNAWLPTFLLTLNTHLSRSENMYPTGTYPISVTNRAGLLSLYVNQFSVSLWPYKQTHIPTVVQGGRLMKSSFAPVGV